MMLEPDGRKFYDQARIGVRRAKVNFLLMRLSFLREVTTLTGEPPTALMFGGAV